MTGNDYPDLPVREVLPQLRAALSTRGAAVLEAPPGAGKSTLVPLELLRSDDEYLRGKQILMLEPRRLAARSVAARMAELRGETVGDTIGYRVRFDQRISDRTRIEVVTEGILTRRIQSDPELANVGLVIFDEFHERNLHGDLALALCLETRAALREDLRVLVMSATLEDTASPVARLLGNGDEPAPILTSSGRSFPVEVRHLPEYAIPDGRLYPAAIATAVAEAIVAAATNIAAGTNGAPGVNAASAANAQGDVLVFLPGVGEIRRVERLLQETRSFPANDWVILALYGDLSRSEQDAALRPDARGRRKLILATTLAETSLTIEGVTLVIDSGLRRAPRYDPATGLSRLDLVRISRASAEQRAGRAGRLGPGQAVRLWSVHDHDRLAARTTPEIQDADLAPLLLELAAWGVPVRPDQPIPLPLLDAPPPAHVRRALVLLRELGALESTNINAGKVSDRDSGSAAGEKSGPTEAYRISAIGRDMVRLPVHPRLARMLCAARENGSAAPAGIALAADLAAILSERDPLRSGSGGEADIRLRLDGLARFRNGAHSEGDTNLWRTIDQVARQLRQLVGGAAGESRSSHATATSSVLHTIPESDLPGALLALAFPDRVGIERKNQAGRYLLASGQGAAIGAVRPGVKTPLALVALDLATTSGAESNEIRLLATLTPATIEAVFAERLVNARRIEWDAKTERVVWSSEIRFQSLVLASSSASDVAPNDDAIAEVFLKGVGETLRRGGTATLATDAADREKFLNLRDRIEFLRRLNFSDIPGVDHLPDLSEEYLIAHPHAWLADHVVGMRGLAELRKSLRLSDVIAAALPYTTLNWMDRAAPTHLEVPSGSRIALKYEGDEAVLAVKLQEMFGLRETPRVALGRVPVTLHLLSPARRPIQVTRDLAGFWERTYAEVKKELKGRYPRHPWPDDPFDPVQAVATRYTKKRIN